MKNQITTLVVLFVMIQINAQQKNIFTKSVKINEFIPFIVNNFQKDLDSIKNRQITFLLPIHNTEMSIEKKIILKQGFQLLSDRLTEDDSISIVAYANVNGLVLESISAKEIKSILYAIENTEKNISQTVKDGIQLGYETADNNFNENAVNTIVMIRDTEFTEKATFTNIKKEKKPKSNAVLLTLLSLTPEVLRIIKE